MNVIGKEQIVWELEQSRKCIYDNLEISPSIFVFPYGLKENETEDVLNAIVNSKYSYAFLSCREFLHRKANPFLLPRFDGEVENEADFFSIAESRSSIGTIRFNLKKMKSNLKKAKIVGNWF